MRCNYFEYRDMMDKTFYGVALTNNHMNSATEQIRRYLVNGGAGEVMQMLHIGIRVITRENLILGKETVSQRFIWLDGERKGEELTINEICNIGMFLKHGAFYNKVLV